MEVIVQTTLAVFLIITFVGMAMVGMNALVDFTCWILVQAGLLPFRISAWMTARKERREQKDGNTKLL